MLYRIMYHFLMLHLLQSPPCGHELQLAVSQNEIVLIGMYTEWITIHIYESNFYLVISMSYVFINQFRMNILEIIVIKVHTISWHIFAFLNGMVFMKFDTYYQESIHCLYMRIKTIFKEICLEKARLIWEYTHARFPPNFTYTSHITPTSQRISLISLIS